MKKVIVIILCQLFSGLVTFSQEKVFVKKGAIYVNKKAVAEFDGKGGAMRRSNYNIKAFGTDSILITVYERDQQILYNPLFEEMELHLYDLTFASHPGKTFVLDVHPYISKFMGNVVVNYRSKWGSDLIEELFNDSVPLLINDGKLDIQNVENFIKNVCYPYDAKMASIKKVEDTIAILSKSNIVRDTKKPVTLQRVTNPAVSYVEWYNIIQDGTVIGQLRQLKVEGRIRADYEIWKKTPANSTLQGKQVEFVPIAMVLIRTPTVNQEYQAIKVSGKERFTFKSSNPMNAELDIINTMISMGAL